MRWLVFREGPHVFQQQAVEWPVPIAGSPVYRAEAALKDDEAGRVGMEEAMGWVLLAGA